MVYKELRHKVWVWLLFFTILATFACSRNEDPNQWKQWFVFPFFFFFLYICGKFNLLFVKYYISMIDQCKNFYICIDLMFGNETSFMFEPTSYQNWRDATESAY